MWKVNVKKQHDFFVIFIAHLKTDMRHLIIIITFITCRRKHRESALFSIENTHPYKNKSQYDSLFCCLTFG